MADCTGTWDVTLRTPIGSIDVVYTFTADEDGELGGTATARDEEVALRDLVVRPEPRGERVAWRQSIARPMRLNLDFDVQVVGDELHGHSRAGRLPRSTVVGIRRRD